MMKTGLAVLIAALFAVSISTLSRADDTKPVTLTGKMECAHCVLHEGTECHDILLVKDGDKEVRYEVVLSGDNKGKHVCQGAKEVKITGTVAEKDGKKTLTATKVEDVKP